MTGVDNGALRKLELKLERPLQRIVCIAHGVELSLRKIFEAIGNQMIINLVVQVPKHSKKALFYDNLKTRMHTCVICTVFENH